jgi:HEAT repeat protein
VALWRLADTSSAGALIAHLRDPDPEVRWRVAYALEKLPLPARVVPAVAPLLADAAPLVRAHAARTLGREKSRLATPALLAALHDADPAVLVNVLRSLQQVADSSSAAELPALAAALGHADPYVRVTAATAHRRAASRGWRRRAAGLRGRCAARRWSTGWRTPTPPRAAPARARW